MERLTVNLNNEHSVGLGDNLCLLSSLTNIPVPIDLYTSNNHSTFDRLTQYKKIFRIPDGQLQIYLTNENGRFDNVGWPLKLFTDYFKPNFVTVNGQTIQTKTKKDREKKFIAIAGYVDHDYMRQNKWPWSRARPQEYWNKIYGWIKSMGYEAVSVDHAYTNLEDKIEIMAKHCRAIISYEGGMAHLAHMLKLPCFLIDWKLPSPSTTLNNFHCEFVHKTNSVYIVRDDYEILGWDRNVFDKHIDDLHDGKTNNRLVNGECKLTFQGPGIRGKVKVLNHRNEVKLHAEPIYGDSKVAELLTAHYFNSGLVSPK
jgi:hypothetical protein